MEVTDYSKERLSGELDMDDVEEALKLKRGVLTDLTTDTFLQFKKRINRARIRFSIATFVFLLLYVGTLMFFEDELYKEFFSEETIAYFFEEGEEFKNSVIYNWSYDNWRGYEDERQAPYTMRDAILLLLTLAWSIVCLVRIVGHDFRFLCPFSGKLLSFRYAYTCPCCERERFKSHSQAKAVKEPPKNGDDGAGTLFLGGLMVLGFIVWSFFLWSPVWPMSFWVVLFYALTVSSVIPCKYLLKCPCGIYPTSFISPYTGGVIFLSNKKSRAYEIRVNGSTSRVAPVENMSSFKAMYLQRLREAARRSTGFDRDVDLAKVSDEINSEIRKKNLDGHISKSDRDELFRVLHEEMMRLTGQKV